VEAPASPLGGGREAEILDLGDGTVLRRYRGVGFPEREGLVMEHARRHGYPVPRVVEIRENALVLERIDGPTMARDALRRPWRARAHMRLLAELHQRLHAIEAPPGLAPAGPGSTLIHLDFHPENVLLSRDGPVVIDWTNARSPFVARLFAQCADVNGGLERALRRAEFLKERASAKHSRARRRPPRRAPRPRARSRGG